MDPDAVKRHVADTAVSAVNADTIPTSDTFRYLALQIIDAFHFIIYNLSNPQSKDVVKEIGFTHSKYNGQIKETDINGFCAAAIKVVPLEGGARFDNLTWLHYKYSLLPFSQAIQYLLGSAFNKVNETAWSAFLKHTADFFNEGLQEGYKLMATGKGEAATKRRLTRTMTYKLSHSQINAIREDWSAIVTNVGLEKCGIELIRFMFELHPDYKIFYANFRCMYGWLSNVQRRNGGFWR